MNKILLTSLLAVPSFMFAQTVILSDNFDSYTAGAKVVAQSAGLWDTWSGGAGTAEDADVSAQFSSSPNNSMNVYNPAPQTFTHDMILEFPSVYTTGRYEFTMKMYVPTGKGGYFNLGGAWTTGGAGYEYGADLFFNGNGTGFVDAPGTMPFTYMQNTWTNIRVVVDLDLDTKTVFINGTSVGSNAWGAAAGFGVVDIFGLAYATEAGSSLIASNFYVDDIVLTRTTGVGIEENDLFTNTILSPNPNNGTFSIEFKDAKVDGYKLSVLDLAGSVVYEQNVIANGTVDVHLSVPSGLYFVRLSDGAKTSTQKIIVQ